MRHSKRARLFALATGLVALASPELANAFFASLIASFGVSFGAGLAAGMAKMVAFKMALVTSIGGLLVSALAPKPKGPKQQAWMSNSRTPAAEHVWVYGRARVGGVIVYEEATDGYDDDDENIYLWRVIAVAGHEIDSYEGIYAFDEQLSFGTVTDRTPVDTNRYDPSAPGRRDAPPPSTPYSSRKHRIENNDDAQEVRTPEKWYGKILVETFLGTPNQTASSWLTRASSGLWTAAHRMRGIAYVIARYEFDIDAFPNGAPTLTFDIKGRKVLNHTTGLTRWSNNWALCLADLLANHPTLKSTINTVNAESVKAAQIVSDEWVASAAGNQRRYTANGAFSLAETPRNAIENMLRAGAGDAWFSGGEWVIRAGSYTAPVMTLESGDFTSLLNVGSASSRQDRYNAVRGTFRGDSTNWQPSDYPPVESSVFLSQDNNVESVIEIDTPFVSDSARAQRLAKIMLYRMREELAVQCSATLKAFGLTVGDTVALTHERFGWTEKVFQVREWTFAIVDGRNLVVNLKLRETSADVYDWSVSDESVFALNNTVLPGPWQAEEVGISHSEELRKINQEVFGVLIINLTTSRPHNVAYYDVEIGIETEDRWKHVGSGQSARYEWHLLEPSTVSLRARSINHLGVKSDWTYETGIQVTLLAAPPEDVQGLEAVSIGRLLSLSWTPVGDLDLSHYVIRRNQDTAGHYAGAAVVVARVARPASTITIPFQTGKYFLVAVDKLGRQSVTPAEIVVEQIEDGDYKVYLTGDETPAFGGGKDNTAVATVGTKKHLRLANYASNGATGKYRFNEPNTIDFGSVRTVLLRPSIAYSIHSDSVTLIDSLAGNIDSLVGNWDSLGVQSTPEQHTVVVQARHTQDDPSASPTWDAWYTLGSECLCTARATRLRVLITTAQGGDTASIYKLGYTALLPRKSEVGSETSGTATGGKTITFDTPFTRLDGLIISPDNLGSGNHYVVSAKSNTGYNVIFRNAANTVISKDFDWHAVGI